MSKQRPVVLTIIGKSGSGKTTLILKLLPELKRKGYRVAAAKHCPHGFDLDVAGKDSWRFAQAGGEGIFLSSQKDMALLRPLARLDELRERLQNYFFDFDFVLMEGYNNHPEIEKMQIIRQGIGELDKPVQGVLAYISDMPLKKNKPLYNIDDISGISKFIERLRWTQ